MTTKKSPGRPRVPPENKRSRSHTLWLSPAEAARVERAAGQAVLPVATWMRRAVVLQARKENR